MTSPSSVQPASSHPGSTDSIEHDRRLVRKMMAGDEAAMNAFADLFFPRLYRYALARLRGNSDLARDLVQATVCKALEKLAGYRGEAPLFGWLCGCCRNEIAMHFRAAGSRPRSVELFDDLDAATTLPGSLGSAPSAPHESLERKEEAARVHGVLDELPPHYAQALEWKYVDRLSVVEIARRLELGPKAAESILTRARNAFRKGYRRLTPRAAVALEAGGMEP